jgi:hypothetical protein
MDDHHHNLQLNSMAVGPRRRGGLAVNQITSGLGTHRSPQISNNASTTINEEKQNGK